jgi:hypothetical protein
MMKLVLALGIGLLCAVDAGASQEPGKAASDPGWETVRILRVVNTVEAQLGRTDGAYRPLGAVLASSMFKEAFPGASASDSATVAVGRRTLILVTSEDQKHYQAMVAPADECGVSTFTNETGLIYSGRALGCDERN